MATQTLTQRETDASIAAQAPIEVLAGGTPTTPVLLAIDLGHCTGRALRSACGVITSGVAEFRPDRWQGGGMKFLRFRRWLAELKSDVGGLDAVLYEQVRSHAGGDASHAYGGWLASPPGASTTAFRIRVCPSLRSSGTLPARATPTSRR